MNGTLANDNDINEVPLQSHKKRDGSLFLLMHLIVRRNVMLVQWLDTMQRYGVKLEI